MKVKASDGIIYEAIQWQGDNAKEFCDVINSTSFGECARLLDGGISVDNLATVFSYSMVMLNCWAVANSSGYMVAPPDVFDREYIIVVDSNAVEGS